MALGTALAIGAAVGGSVLSASSNKKAAGKAADASLAAAQENNALSREIYGRNEATLSPFVNSGVTAGNYLNAFLGLPTQATTTTSGQPNYASYVQSSPDLLAEWNRVKGNSQFGGDISNYGQWHYNNYGQTENRSIPGQTVTTTPAVTQGQAQNAFASFLTNSDYGYQSALGGQQVAGNYSGLGQFQSGAAMKALQDRQNNINQGYQTNWLGQLAGQQGVGLSGASALAGVGQNYAASVGSNNTNAANAAANAALIKGNNNPFAAGLGALAGTFLG